MPRRMPSPRSSHSLQWSSPEQESTSFEDFWIPARQPRVLKSPFRTPSPSSTRESDHSHSTAAPQNALSIPSSFSLIISGAPEDPFMAPPPRQLNAASPPPSMRQNEITAYHYGVVTGSILIDMAEWLSRSSCCRCDWALSLWIQEHYIEPFAWIERLDGIIVESQEDMIILDWAHQRYSDLRPMPDRKMPRQVIWVPGLEPTYDERGVVVREPVLPEKFMQYHFDASETRIRKERRGYCVGTFRDGMGWERSLWELPNLEEDEAIEAEKSVEDMVQEMEGVESFGVGTAQPEGPIHSTTRSGIMIYSDSEGDEK